ncbi:MAG: hypothetical protein ACAH59_13365 [Pseudobdellovibrionaceae bacterium]
MKKYFFLSLLISVLASGPAYSVNSCRAIYANAAATPSASNRFAGTDLSFKVRVGKVEEHSIRQGDTAAHVYLDSTQGQNPYLFAGFPAGNSGIGFWFKSAGMASIQAMASPRALAKSNDMNGIEIPLRTEARELVIDDSILGSMRFIRDRELGKNILVNGLGKLLHRITTNQVSLREGKLYFSRKGINGIAKYEAEITPLGNTRILAEGNTYRLISDTEVQFKLSASTNEKPLTPIAMTDFFTKEALAKMDPKRLMEFSFLAFKEKLMAGSPRYFSKFGRDSIYTLKVLMPAMKPEAVENLLTAILNSLDPRTGQVSHEQHEGDFTSFVRLKRKEKYLGVDKMIEDTKMIDDDLAAVIVFGEFFKRHPERVKDFLNRREARGLVQRDLLIKLFRHVETQAEPFTEAVLSGKIEDKNLFRYLLGLKGHELTGQWRDSEAGLGFGKYPFDVNAVFVPGALKALAELAASSHPGNEFHDPSKAQKLNQMFEIWNTKAEKLFRLRVAKENLEAYAQNYYRNTGRDLKTLPSAPKQDLDFHAISIDKDGKPVPILHSDDSLMMTFGHPTASHLRLVSQRVRLQFPYGLATQKGLLVANPIFASPDLQIKFGPDRYHGTVIWTMQEDLMIFGLNQQLQRADSEIPIAIKQEVSQNIQLIESMIHRRGDWGGIEVFSVREQNGQVEVQPFAGDAKGNSNQLWSHLRLVFGLKAK